MRHIVRILVLLSVMCFFAEFVAIAQIAPDTDQGVKPYDTLQGSAIDKVSLTNGSLFVNIPLISYPQRGGKLKLGFSLVYTNKQWTHYSPQCPNGLAGTNCIWYWSPNSTASLSPYVVDDQKLIGTTTGGRCPSGESVVSSDGATHPVVGLAANSTTCWSGATLNYETVDGTAMSMSLTSNTVPPMVIGPDGVQHYPGTGSNSYVPLREDSNGNQISVFTDSAHVDHLLDTMGRQITFQTSPVTISPGIPSSDTSHCTGSLPISSVNVWTLPGPNGGNVSFKFCMAKISIQTNFQVPYEQEYSATGVSILQSLVLPNNTAWTFEYSDRNSGDGQNVNYGTLTKITFPTGGSISYTYTSYSEFWGNDSPATNAGLPVKSRTVASRTVDANDGAGPHSWTYQWSTPTPGQLGNVVVTNPNENQTLYTLSNCGAGGSFAPTEQFYERTRQIYQGLQSAGQLLRTIQTDYNNQCLPIHETITLENGTVSKTETDYDSSLHTANGGTNSYGQPVAIRDYDYSGALVRQTITSFYWQTFPSYLTSNLIDLPKSIEIEDAGGNRCSETDYAYDDPNRLIGSGITTQHGSPTGLRGNPSSTTQLLSATPCQASASWRPISSYSNYFDTGMLYQAINPLGHTTTYSYQTTSFAPADFLGSFPTQVTNALNQNVFFNYDFSTGLKTTTEDENGNVTSSSYDEMGRIIQSNFPDNGLENWTYTDVANPNVNSNETVYEPSGTSYVIRREDDMDGLGRTIHSKLLSDPQGTTISDTTYDPTGRLDAQSNPYRSTSESTYGATDYDYDALGRTITVIPPDGSIGIDNTSTSYSDNVTTVTDEQGHTRRSITDALGQLSEVDEPGGTAPSTTASSTVTVNGSDQSMQVQDSSATSGSATTSISGSEQVKQVVNGEHCAPEGPHGIIVCTPTYTYIYDSGTLTATVNGVSRSVNYGASSTATLLASSLAAAFGNDSQVIARSSNSSIIFTATAAGSNTNYSLTASSSTSDSSHFSSPSFVPACGSSTTSCNSSLTGGQNAVYGTVYDAGSITLGIADFTAAVTYGQTSTAATLASGLAQIINNNSTAPVTATLSSTSIQLHAKMSGSVGNYQLTLASQSSQSKYFSSPSFSDPSNTGSAMSGGSDGATLNTPAVTKYSYDPLGNLILVQQQGTAGSCDSNCRIRQFTYDSFSRLLTAQNPESGLVTYSYDDNGNLKAKKDADGVTITYTYDPLNRLTQKTYSNSDHEVDYSYDQNSSNGLTVTNGIGRRTGMSDGSGQSAWSYDSMGRVITEQRTTSGITAQTNYTYNTDGTVASITYPHTASGIPYTVTYSYSTVGRATSAVGSDGTNFASNVTYAPQGALATILNGSAITTSNSYNSRLQPIFLTAATASNTILNLAYNFALGYADNGNVLQVINNKDNTRSVAYTYDDWNRLLTAQTSNWSQNFTYDIFGNLYNVTSSSAPSFCATVLSNNQLGVDCTATSNPASSANPAYSYDPVGDMTMNVGPNNMTSSTGMPYTFDAEKQLICAGCNSGSVSTSYAYDGDGRRVAKSSGTLYWYGVGGEVLQETDLSGVWQHDYIFFDGKRIARQDPTVIYDCPPPPPPGQTSSYCPPPYTPLYFYFSDHLGSATVVTDANGTIQEESDFYPFGGEHAITDLGIGNNYKFTAKERDSESNLDNFGARYFASGLGRFITPDWSANAVTVPYAVFGDPQTLNLYSYVENAPINHVDADGHGGSQLGDDVKGGGDLLGKELARLQAELKAAAEHSPDNNRFCICGRFKDSLKFLGQELIGVGKQALNTVTSTMNLATSVHNNMYIPNSGTNIPQLHSSSTGQTTGMVVTGLALLAAPFAEGGTAASVAQATADSSSVFYSGPGTQAAAETWAAANNGTTIGMTQYGAAIDNGTMTAESASEAFANSASGTAHVFSNDPLTNFGNIWYNYELPALADNPNVTNLVIHPVP